jgi:hypothetical protein
LQSAANFLTGRIVPSGLLLSQPAPATYAVLRDLHGRKLQKKSKIAAVPKNMNTPAPGAAPIQQSQLTSMRVNKERGCEGKAKLARAASAAEMPAQTGSSAPLRHMPLRTRETRRAR